MVRAPEIPPILPPVADRQAAQHQPQRTLHGSGLLSEALLATIQQRAKDLGFSALGVASAAESPATLRRLNDWIANGSHGEMLWMAETPERRAHPRNLWPDVNSILMLGVNYGTRSSPLSLLDNATDAALALYARRRDYHDVIKGRLKELAGFIVAKGGGDIKVFVDTAPVMERPLAMAAGIGWQGKNTNLVSRQFGSWLFLAAIYTTLHLPENQPERDHCGGCTRCLDICPTMAFPEPYVLDARRCISYLTIEHKGVIPAPFRKAIGNRIYGCDDCLAICPWNKFAVEAQDQKLALRNELSHLSLRALAALDDGAFRQLFAGTPIKRTGRDRFVRNVMIAIGNSDDTTLVPVLLTRLTDVSPLVRAMAIWALKQMLPRADWMALAQSHAGRDPDHDVQQEWREDTEGAQ